MLCVFITESLALQNVEIGVGNGLQEYLVKFNEKCFEVELTSDVIRIRGGVELEIRERIITVRGALSSEVYNVRNGKKKAIYIRHIGVTARCENSQKLVEEVSSPFAYIKYTKSRLGGYLTIITPSRFFTDYVVIDESTIAIVLPGRREVYAEKIDDTLILYIA